MWRKVGTVTVCAVVFSAMQVDAYPIYRGEIDFDVDGGVFVGAYHPDDFFRAEVETFLRGMCTAGALRSYKEHRGVDGFLVFNATCKGLSATVAENTKFKVRRTGDGDLAVFAPHGE